MSETRPARPPQVTMAGWMVVAGSVLVVLMAFSQVADLRSIQTRETVERYLSEPPGDALGLGVQGMLQVLRITAMVAAACAAASAILGWQVLQRSKGARVALSVLAVPLLVTGLVGGGIAAAVVVAAITMLWFQPARDWFEGRAPAPRPVAPRNPLLDLPPPSAPPLSAASFPGPTGRSPVPVPLERPASVRWACVITWGFAGLAFVTLALTLALSLARPDALVDEVVSANPDLADRGVTAELVRDTVYATCAVVMSWSLTAIALAVLTWRRVRWAALALMVSAGCASLLCLLLVLGSVVMVLPMAACATALALLLRPESRRWYAAR